MLLFGGDIQVMHTDKLLTIDDNVKYGAYAKTGVMFKELRKLLDSVLARKLDNPRQDITSKCFSFCYHKTMKRYYIYLNIRIP